VKKKTHVEEGGLAMRAVREEGEVRWSLTGRRSRGNWPLERFPKGGQGRFKVVKYAVFSFAAEGEEKCCRSVLPKRVGEKKAFFWGKHRPLVQEGEVARKTGPRSPELIYTEGEKESLLTTTEDRSQLKRKTHTGSRLQRGKMAFGRKCS